MFKLTDIPTIIPHCLFITSYPPIIDGLTVTSGVCVYITGLSIVIVLVMIGCL